MFHFLYGNIYVGTYQSIRTDYHDFVPQFAVTTVFITGGGNYGTDSNGVSYDRSVKYGVFAGNPWDPIAPAQDNVCTP